MSANNPDQARLLTLRSGGWVLLLGAALTIAVLVWGLLGIIVSDHTSGRPGHPEASDFDLAGAIVPLDLIVSGSEPGLIRALIEPEMIPASRVAEINDRERGKFLVADEFVLGVEIAGDARAYPIRVLQWHEIINDTIGGVPVAVTYNGLCDSAAVFDRRIDGRVVEFEVSGLVYNSNLVMVDGHTDGASRTGSLWSQLQSRAITGPEAGAPLAILPCALVSWRQWSAAYPETVVLAPNPDPRLERYYRRDAYGSYQSSDALKFPVRPLPPREGRAFKARMLAIVGEGGERHAVSIDELLSSANDGGTASITAHGSEYATDVFSDPEAVLVRTPDGSLAPVIYSYWFAWYALVNEESAPPEAPQLRQ